MRRNGILLWSASIGLGLIAASCTGTAGTGGPWPGPGGPPPEARSRGTLGIPAGHLPPPGECRLWYPGEPAGQQPPPGRCDRMVEVAPPGAWVLYRPKQEHVHVREIDPRRAGVVREVRVYDAVSGVFLHLQAP